MARAVSPPPPSPSSWSGHLPLAAVACVALATFANSLAAGFVWDDRAAILTNLDIRTDGPFSAWDLFRHDFWGTLLTSPSSHKSFRPFTVLTFRLNYALSGFDPWGYHMTNVLLHVASSVLVVVSGRAVCTYHDSTEKHGSTLRRAPVFAGLIFAVHPIHCDSVASIVGRADVLCTLVSLLAFLAYHRAMVSMAERPWSSTILFGLAQALVVVATLCKELGATTLGIFVVLECIHAIHNSRLALAGILRLGLVLGGGVVGILGRVALNGSHVLYQWTAMENNIALLPPGLARALTTAHTHAWYLYKIVWPQHLCYDYGYKTIPTIESITDPRNLLTLLAYAAVLALVVVAIRSLRATPALLLMVAFGAVPFVPAANVLFPVGTIVAERLLYFPSVGVSFLAGYAADVALCQSHRVHPTWMPPLLYAVGGVVLAIAAARSVRRNMDWANEHALFEASIRVAPWSTKVLSNLSKVLLNGDPPRAAAYLDRALTVLPRYPIGFFNLGLAYVNMGKLLHGVDNLMRAIEVEGSLSAYAYLGKYAYEFYLGNQHGQFKTTKPTHAHATAQKLLDYALDNGQNLPVVCLTRGLLAYYAGDVAGAIPYLERTLRENDRVHARGYDLEELVDACTVYSMLALANQEQGDRDRAFALYISFSRVSRLPANVFLMLFLSLTDRLRQRREPRT
ncbi:Aste57867_11614 [Aphanomyces stellatus]|uniref:Aste57867_11614 protein n=1 Tax=Aphanomyces stellatus TaxID=120398 RepID=A0A485KTG6_9STRA|nr:hypothetical protein As57867_011571 [Aphanomyces stellatus]VFT88472.1 Aste57867_11614 [Aphanomyces stellatus]